MYQELILICAATYVALNKLGLNCYHMVECGRNSTNNGSFERWKEAIEAKYYGGKGRRLQVAEDFDELLWQYQVLASVVLATWRVVNNRTNAKQAVSDIPCILFADELLEAYPDAKVILTTRDEDGWIKSMQNSFYSILSWRMWTVAEILDTVSLSTR